MPDDWLTQDCVKNILAYRGSAEFWMPVRAAVQRYTQLNQADLDEREQVLHAVRTAIDNWRRNQQKNLWLSNLDRNKEASLRALEGLMRTEDAAVATARRPVAPTLPISIRPSGEGGAPNSFTEALENSPELSRLGLGRSVMQHDVTLLTDQRKCRIQVGQDGTLRTHDGRFAIDTGDAVERYLILVEDGESVLYGSQSLSETDSRRLRPGEALTEYPTLVSHAQIDGDVICAGDMLVHQGRIKQINNQSGTWQPGGANLAKALKLLVRMRALSEQDIVRRNVTVQQFIHRPEGYNVDGGSLKTLLGDSMLGKLSRRLRPRVPTNRPERPEQPGHRATTAHQGHRPGRSASHE